MPRFIFSFLLLLSLPMAAIAHEYKAGDLEIIHPWTRSTADKAHNGVAYLTIVNHGKSDDRLISASTDAADRVGLHQIVDDNGIMRMKELPGGIELPAGQTVKIEPGGLHLMLTGLHNALKAGKRVKMTLTFAKAGEVPVELTVQDHDEPQVDGVDGMDGMDHGAMGDMPIEHGMSKDTHLR